MSDRFIRLRAGHTQYERPDWLDPSVQRLAYYRDGRHHDGSYPWGRFPTDSTWGSERGLLFREDVRTVDLRNAHGGIGVPLDFATTPKYLFVAAAPHYDLTVFPV
jgi:hypothetical protein